jgi:large subunit ribosomal protein L15
MLKLNELQPAKGSRRKTKRLGRGTGSGTGCTAGKGNNGYKARRGASNKFYFEGGQTPLTRRIPKKGFNNIFKKEFQIVNVAELDTLDETDKEIDVAFLHEKGLIHEVDRPVKILGNGELKKTFTVKVHAFSKAAREKIENAKGKAEVIDRA